MTPFRDDGGRPHQLTLSRDLVRSLRRGHPWVFRDALRNPPRGQPGDLAELKDKRGRVIARGYSDPTSPLSFRACTSEPRQPLDERWATERFSTAMDLRRPLLQDPTTNAYRLFCGEGDGLPGLVCDVYDRTAVIRLDGPAAEGFWRSEVVAEWLTANAGVDRVVERLRSRGGAIARVLVGEVNGPVPFLENNHRFTANVLEGQKTGFFLDQRENRRRVGDLCEGRTLLNVFGFTGGFSIYGAVAGASHVTTIDQAGPALAMATQHMKDNGIDADRHEEVCDDAFSYLDEASRQGRVWDVVVLDPPSFAPNQRSVDKATKAYERLIAAGTRVCADGGWVLAASCSSHIGMEDFLRICQDGVGMARARARVAGNWGQPLDHPWPLACPDLRYLKAVLLRIERG